MKILIRGTSKLFADEHIIAPEYDKAKHEIKILVVEIPTGYKGNTGDTFEGFSLDNCLKLFNLESKYFIVYDIYCGAEWQDVNNFVHGTLESQMVELTEWKIGYGAMHDYKYHIIKNSVGDIVPGKAVSRSGDYHNKAVYDHILEILIPYFILYYIIHNLLFK